MSLLAVAYLAVQYMLALFRFRFLFVLAIIAAIEPLLLTGGVHTLEGFAALVLAIQCAAAVSMLALSLRARTSAARPAHTVGLEPAD
jgi:hypothetical protein